MGEPTDIERKRIVKEELDRLDEKMYISSIVREQVLKAHEEYYSDLEQSVKNMERKLEKEQNEDTATTSLENRPIEKDAVANSIKQPKPKKQRTAAEIRERNMTWALYIGVILLLTGGLVLATSRWATFTDGMKSGLIALVAVLFYGMAFLSERVLKIKRTASAFYILGSLFLPIVIISIGFFELLGSYFSIFGEGRYLFGASGSLVIFPIYALTAIKRDSRLFVWLTYISVTLLAGFILAFAKMPVDRFYFGLMLYNVLLVAFYQWQKSNSRLRLFMYEFTAYIQANLILSTLLLVVFYQNDLAHGFNLLLTALIYFSMIFVTNHKNYHFVFSTMLVYGAYQIINFSALHQIDAVAYALLGFFFLIIPAVAKDDASLRKVFRYTSAVVSFAAFLFITVQGFVVHGSDPSIILMLAYILMTLNFLALSNMATNKLFSYLAPVFFMRALYEAILIVQVNFDFENVSEPMFLISLIVYLVLGSVAKPALLHPIKASTRDVSLLTVFLCLFFNVLVTDLWRTGIMLILVSLIAIVMHRVESRSLFQTSRIPFLLHTIPLGLGVAFLFQESGTDQVSALNDVFVPLDPLGLITGSLIVMGAGLLWKNRGQMHFYDYAFYTSHVFYFIGVLNALQLDIDAILRAAIILGSAAMAYVLYRKAEWPVLPYAVGGLTLMFYFTALQAFLINVQIDSEIFDAMRFPAGAILLFAAGVLLGKIDRALWKGFMMIGHIHFPLALLASTLFYWSAAIWPFLMAVLVYGISMKKAQTNWQLDAFLYAGLTSVWVVLSFFFIQIEQEAYSHYAFFITSGLIMIGWMLGEEPWTRRIARYFVPFSMIGLAVFTNVVPLDIYVMTAIVLYSAGMLFVMHKESWDIFNVIPLILVFKAVITFGDIQFDSAFAGLFVFYAVTAFAGYVIYPALYDRPGEKGDLPSVDWYSVIALVSLAQLYQLTGEDLWTQLAPGIFIVFHITLQRKRIPHLPSRWIVFLAAIYLLEPYYTFIDYMAIPDVFIRSSLVMPWVVLAIVLKKVGAPGQQKIINYIQWAVLVIGSLLLVQDGLERNSIYDALLIGTLSLLSMLGGMAYRMKSFFFIGAGVLLLNVLLQSRPFWGNMPWWAYLLISGSILVAIASLNEWHKQKTADEKETFITVLNRKIVRKIREWE